ncbi:hypothetical protein DKX38_006921 [Salix brachista]|uniref:Uncharacterized protein n=1 Tax=Salix brachista TaxID=2182728 RepID=A0A5N5MLU2_9ROSI|nr:hypothetical protein DKX38_006921 [Salix brachista]
MLPDGRVNVQINPTAETRPSGRREPREGVQINPTAETRPGGRREPRDGFFDANPTATIVSDREYEQPAAGVHPTAGMSWQTSGQLTCGLNPTVQMAPDKASRRLNPTAQMTPDGASRRATRGLPPTAENVANRDNEQMTSGEHPTAEMQSDEESGGLLTSGRRERVLRCGCKIILQGKIFLIPSPIWH